MLSFLSRHLFPASRAALNTRPEAESMEPRLLYSADVMPAGLDGEFAVLAPEVRTLDDTAAAWLAPAAEISRSNAIVFIDATVEDSDTLLADLRRDNPSLEVVTLDADRDGIAQISAALAGRDGLDAIHIISHGAAGQLQLGNSTLDAAALEANAQSVAAWGAAITDTADILLYGCDVAGNANGVAFVAALAGLTGADVAASDNRTGAQSAGGDWSLEHHAGRIEASAFAAPTWTGSLGVSAVSGDIAVSGSTSGEQRAAGVAMLENGTWMAVWEYDVIFIGEGIGARMFDASGSPLSANPNEFPVDVGFSGTQNAPAIASNGSDTFVVVWVSDENGNQDIFMRRFNATGSALGGEVQVNTGTTAATSGDQNAPRVAMNSSGEFVVTWGGSGPGDSIGVFARRFNSDGSANGGVFTVNQDTNGKQVTPDVALTDDGRFVVTWDDDGGGDIIRARTYAANGTAGGVINVQSVSYGGVTDPAVAMDASGNFVVVWAENGFDGSQSAVLLQRFDASGIRQGAAIPVNTYTDNDQERPQIAMNARGDFVVTWESNKQDGSVEGIYLRSFEAGGVNPGLETKANTYITDYQELPVVALNNAGQLVVVWSGRRSGGSGDDLGGKTFIWTESVTSNTAPVLTITSPTMTGFDEDDPEETKISALVSLGGNVSDPDAGALTGIALVGVDATNGVWHFRSGTGDWTLINAGTLSSSNALLLDSGSNTAVRFTPNANFNGTVNPAITFRAWDRTSGGSGTFANTDVNGGTTAFSTATDTATLTVNPVNDAPVISRNQLTLSEGQTIALGTAQLDASDVESAASSLTYAVDSVSAGFFALAVTPGAAITSFTQQQIIDGNIVFVHDGGEAAPAYTLTLTDGNGGNSAASAANIAFTNVNDAPVLADASPAISVLQGNGAPSGAVGVRVSTLVSLSSSGSGPQNVTDPDSSAIGIAIIAADETRGQWYYSTNNGTSWQLLNLGALPAGEARLLAANSNTRLYFHETAGGGATVANALTFHAWDRSSGSNGGRANPTPGGGSSAFSTATDTVALTITATNARPVLDTSPTLVIQLLEDAPAPVGTTGFLVSGLVSFVGASSGPKNVTDADAGAQTGIAVVATNTPDGQWWYSTNGGTNWTQIAGGLSDSNALLLAADGQTRLYYQPATANAFGTEIGAISFKAWDQTSGSNGETGVNTGTGTAFSTATETADVEVQPVNDLPTVTANSLTISEGNTVTLGIANFNSSDVEESDRSKLVFTIGSVSGGVFFNTVTTSVVTNFTQADMDAGRIEFRHDGNEAAPAYTFSVSDGTASTASVTGAITFSNLNDAPALTPTGTASYSLDENAGVPSGSVGAPVTALVSLNGSGSGPENVSDPDAAGLSGIAITGADSTNGIWYWSNNDGTSWNPLGSVSNTSARLLTAEAGMRIAFAPDANYNGTTTGLTFKAWDRSAWANGAQQDTTVGSAFSSASDTVTLIVRPIDHAPTVVAIDLGTIVEDTGRLITQAELLAGSSDPHGDPLSVINMVLTEGNGGLVDNANGTWTFTPSANWSGSAALSFDVDNGTETVANTARLVVIAGNDAPTVVPIDLGAMAEDGSRLITQAELLAGANDIDGGAMSVSNVALTAGNGTMTNNGNGTWTFTPSADWNGNATFSFKVGDGTTTVANTATLVVTPVNDAPSLSVPARQTIEPGGGTGALRLTVGDRETPASSLTVSARSTNLFMLPDSAIVLSGTGAQRTLSITAGHRGTAGTTQIIIEVSDGSAVTTSSVTVDAVAPSDPPSIPKITPAQDAVVVIEPDDDAQDASTAATPAPAPARTTPLATDTSEDGLGIAETDALTFTPPPQDEVLRITPSSANDASDSRALQIRLSDADILSLTYRTETTTAQLSSGGRIGDAIREAYIARTFDTLRDGANNETDASQQRIGITMVTGAGLTVGYVAWLIRGGVLLTSLLTTMPAWRFLDPLPVLGGVKGDQDGDDDSLEALVAGDSADDDFDTVTDSDDTSIISGARA